MGRKILALLVALFMIPVSAIIASGEGFDSGRLGSISVTLVEQGEQAPIVGAELSVYYIATASIHSDGALFYAFTNTFAEAGIAMDDPALATKLDAFLAQNQATAIRIYTDEDGKAVCSNLPVGLYFVRQTGAVEGYAPCAPFCVTVPVRNEDGYDYEVNASPKTHVAKLTEITIQKVWNTDASTQAADSVTVQLLRNGVVIETAILNAKNNWQVTYADMPESDQYTIQEVNVPQGFTATYKQVGYVFTVTNTSTLIQTGQLIWPIPMLAFLGVVLIGTGCILLQKKREPNA